MIYALMRLYACVNNETACVNDGEGLPKDMYDRSEVMEVTCVNKVQDSSS